MTDTHDPADSAAAQPTGAADAASMEAEIGTLRSRYQALSEELEAVRKTGAAEAEAAVEAARQEGRTSAMAEISHQLVHAELRAHAAVAGVELPAQDFLRLDAFVGEGGAPDSGRISDFVSSLPAAARTPAFAQGLGLGRQGGPAADQLSREDLSRMSHREINEARQAGKLNALLYSA
ncbi:hypothetical protein IPZ58_05130 [Streptomyces roseoverticillatus]|uniref:hypothetical protein n=1 Tax=Streptomyces roseoverticillatus TaxID=66429 RepID=UPI001F1735F3|nr:hypothetical protein [Streptomyces roseoverticillatus]MCF3100958.1 hypothetical protein [Streptomyces roseoverticillatus]